VQVKDVPGAPSFTFSPPADTRFVDVAKVRHPCGITDDNRVGCINSEGEETWWFAPGDKQAVFAKTEEPCVLASGDVWCTHYSEWPPAWTKLDTPVSDVTGLSGTDPRRLVEGSNEWCMIGSDGSLTCQGSWTGSGHPDPAVPKVVEFANIE